MNWACGTRGRGSRVVAFLLLVRGVPFLRIGPKTDYPDRGLSFTFTSRYVVFTQLHFLAILLLHQ